MQWIFFMLLQFLYKIVLLYTEYNKQIQKVSICTGIPSTFGDGRGQYTLGNSELYSRPHFRNNSESTVPAKRFIQAEQF